MLTTLLSDLRYRLRAVFAAVGVILGSIVALLLGKWVEPLLLGVTSRDPAVYIGVAFVILVVALLATLVPALRASRIDPVRAMRVE